MVLFSLRKWNWSIFCRKSLLTLLQHRFIFVISLLLLLGFLQHYNQVEIHSLGQFDEINKCCCCCLCFIFVICPISLPGQLADLVDGWRRASPHSSLKHSLYDPWVLFNYSQSERHVRERAPPAFSSRALQRTEVCITSGTWFALKYIV